MCSRLTIVGTLLLTLIVAPAAQGTLIHQWTFNGDANDQVGTAHGFLRNGASIVGDRLQLDGIDDFMRSAPLDGPVDTRTLVSWVSLDNLTQESGSAITIENHVGADTFDGIVYGERISGQWMNGSNFFSRSVPNNGGAVETTTNPGEVMIAITYDAANNITIYRDGIEYASSAATSQGTLQS